MLLTCPVTFSGSPVAHRIRSKLLRLPFKAFIFYFYFLRFYLFIHERQRERGRERERERQQHRRREKQAPCQEPDVGLDCGSPGSRPGPKPSTKPLSHPGIPDIISIVKIAHLDPWVAQRFSACLWPRARSWSPGIESHIRLLAWSLLLPPPVSLPLSLSPSLCVYHK